jgi:hypothetical protein
VVPPIWLSSKVKLPNLVCPDVGRMVCPIVSVTVVFQALIDDDPSQAVVVLMVCAATGDESAISATPHSQTRCDNTRRGRPRDGPQQALARETAPWVFLVGVTPIVRGRFIPSPIADRRIACSDAPVHHRTTSRAGQEEVPPGYSEYQARTVVVLDSNATE